jgi:hypothetical protein
MTLSGNSANLANLLAAMAIYYQFSFLKIKSGNLLLASIFCQLLGCLTKITLLPLVLILNIVLLVQAAGSIGKIYHVLGTWIKAAGLRDLLLSFGLIICLVLNAGLSGGNYFRYGDISPTMATVLSADISMQNRLEARNRIFSLFKEEQISEEQAEAMASQIKHPGDSEHAIFLIQNYAAQKQNGLKLMGPLQYAPVWIMTMLTRIYGVLAHLQIFVYWPTVPLFTIMALMVITGFVLRWRSEQERRLSAFLTIIAVFYVLFLMYYVNYQAYLYFADLDVSLQREVYLPGSRHGLRSLQPLSAEHLQESADADGSGMCGSLDLHRVRFPPVPGPNHA